MTSLRATSIAPRVADYLRGPRQRGIALGHGYIGFPDYVVAVTSVGAPRMPNGIEADVDIGGADIWAGGGRLSVGGITVVAGDIWNPRPRVRCLLSVSPEWTPRAARLLGWGPGLTPLGDDVLCGYVAGRALLGRATSLDLPDRGTTSLSRVLLRHAAYGELPGPAHDLLERGDPRPLLRWGATSGRALAVGLAAAMAAPNNRVGDVIAELDIDLELPDGPRSFHLEAHAMSLAPDATVGSAG
jgi:hypothetical protein